MDATVDALEVDFYSRLADTWWDPTGPFWPLHRLNDLRQDYIRQRICAQLKLDGHAQRPLDGLSVLDVGCGGGILSESMSRMGARVRGIDVVENNIRVARLHAAGQGIDVEYQLGTIADEVARGNRYDIVLNMEVVEHVADAGSFMRDCCRCVGEHGMMFVATINRTAKAWLFAIVGAEYVLGWLPKGTHQWRRFRAPGEIEAWLQREGLATDDMTGVAANPLTRGLRLCPSTKVNYMLAATRR
jgi:2-polyprenyl-6-hydroxyphenyl methylase/3-demethylubiquinone-9 3-methyltransferase